MNIMIYEIEQQKPKSYGIDLCRGLQLKKLKVNKILYKLQNNLGEEDYLEPLKVLIDSVNRHNNLNFFGRLAFIHQLTNRLKMRARLFELHKKNTFDEPSDPVFVIGLPRSGTSLLFNLLSLDIAHRSPMYWEIMHLMPLAKTQASRKSREFKTNAELKLAKTIIPKLKAIHTIRATTPEECQQIATMNVRSFVYMCMADVPEYVEYLKSTSFDSVFKWHKKFYQALELNGKPTRWLLKDPSHIGHIPQILKEYPNAKFIHIHRDPAESVASFCSLTKNVRLAFSKKIDTDGIGKTVIDFWNHNLSKGMEDRKFLSSDQLVDIQYSEFVKNPLDHIKNTYQQLNFDMNIQTENKIQKYLEQDKNILKPEHRYTLDEFGLNQNDIKGQFKEYMLNYDF